MSKLFQSAHRVPVVLHLEDDRVLARALSVLLRMEGYEVIGATSRNEALDCVGRRLTRPDLILCEYELADGSRGYDVVGDLRQKLSAWIPAVMLAGDRPNERIDEALAVVEQVFQKPLAVDLLLQEMRALLAKAGAAAPRHAAVGNRGESCASESRPDDIWRRSDSATSL